MNNFTRFRAYQLGTKGSLCSYSVDSNFTLIEARINDKVKDSLYYELYRANRNFISTLHITSWDIDHCNYGELITILDSFRPSRIEYPGYTPDTDNGIKSRNAIKEYLKSNHGTTAASVSKEYINGLNIAKPWGRVNIIYNPYDNYDSHNDNSIVKLFRYGRFTVLSLGDCESKEIAESIMADRIATSEVDLLILAHHGADNGFTTKEFIKAINPRVAICTSDRGNMYGHPDEKVRKILNDCGVPLLTTKDGDVLVTCGDDNICTAYNMKGNNDKISNCFQFKPKSTLSYLSHQGYLNC